MTVMTLLAYCWFAVFLSQPPSPTPAKGRQIPREQGTADHSPTKSNNEPSQPNSIVLKQQKANPNDGPNESERAEYPADSPSAIAVAFFTFGLVVLGGLQWWAMRRQAEFMREQAEYMRKQAVYMRRGLRLTRIAADAAKESADVAEQTVEQMRLENRPWLQIGATMQPLVPNQTPSCAFTIRNTGRIPGTITEFKLAFVIADPPGDPWVVTEAIRLHAEDSKPTMVEVVIPPDATAGWTVPVSDLAVSEEDVNSIAVTKNKGVILICRLTYVGATEQPYETQFVFHYDSVSTRFDQHIKHNYMR